MSDGQKENPVRPLTLMLLLPLMGCGQGAARQPATYTIEQFINTTSMTGSAFSPDEERIAFSSDRSGVFNVYVMPVAGGEPTQVTYSDTSAIYVKGFLPDDRILVEADLEGNERSHLYVLAEDGSITDLTPVPGSRAVFNEWSPDGRSFAFGWNKRDEKFMDVYEMDVATLEPRLVYRNDLGFEIGALSPDRRYLALQKQMTTFNSDVYLYDTQTKSLTNITAHEGQVANLASGFSADSRALYYVTDEGDEFRYLVRYDLATGETTVVDKPGWDVSFAFESDEGTYRVVGVNEDATTAVHITRIADGEAITLPDLPDGDIVAPNVSRSEKLMAFYVNGPRSPSDLYIYDFTTNTHRKLVESLNPEMNPADLVQAERVRYASFDGTEIPAILYTPLGLAPDEKVPAVVKVHGGPGGQARTTYDYISQYLANHGYVVIDVNNRGSSGYGKTFYRMDDQKHGDVDLDDCIAAKSFLAERGHVDTSKVAILGGSYGGYMVLAALTFRPTTFAAGVDYYGISNWVRTLKSIPPWWESFREALYVELGDPNTQEEYLYGISPLFHSERIERPLLVLQGANDPRVLKVESDDIVAAVRANGVPVDYIVFDDEGHGFRKKKNRIAATEAALQFLDKHLKGAGEGEEPVASSH